MLQSHADTAVSLVEKYKGSQDSSYMGSEYYSTAHRNTLAIKSEILQELEHIEVVSSNHEVLTESVGVIHPAKSVVLFVLIIYNKYILHI